jgi:hypothetical protein
MTQSNVHLINELPHIYEFEDMLAFCKRYEHLYICGAAENQEYLLKYFDICGINIDGYTVTDPDSQCLNHYRQIPIVSINDVIKQSKTGIILALSDRHYRYFIPEFRAAGFDDYFVMTEYNKRAIANQLKPRNREHISMEINLADHCNLSCQMCDHYSQLSGEHFLDVQAFERDMEQMGKLFEHQSGAITLLGGEPLLHNDIIKCIQIVRENFPESEIFILTNGILLLSLENSPNGNLWAACRDYNVGINVTVYPIKLDFLAIERKASEYGVPIRMSSDIHAEILTKIPKTSDKHTMDLSGSKSFDLSPACIYFNKWTVLKDGKFYMCPVSAHIGIFNKYFNQNLPLTDKDSVDIFSAASWKDFSVFSAKPVPFCRYCDLKDWHAHSQWQASTKQIEEYI